MPRNQSLPWTTQGDTLYYTSTPQRLAAGTAGQWLQTQGNSAGANPRWVAVPAFSCQFATGGTAGYNPLDATTYYFGTLFGVNPGTSDNPPGFFVPIDCTLRAVYGRFAVIGTLGTTEQSTVSIRKNATTDILTVTSTVQLSAAVNDFSITGQNVALSAGDHLYVKFVATTWATNPTNVFTVLNLYCDVP